MKRIFSIYFLAMIGCLTALAQDFVLTGRVMDAQENAIELASVSCLAQGKATMTNLRGEFSLSLRSADSVVIRFSMIGYKTKTRVLRRPKGRQNLQIQLYEDEQYLDNVEVVKRKRSTSTTEEISTMFLLTGASLPNRYLNSLIYMISLMR